MYNPPPSLGLCRYHDTFPRSHARSLPFTDGLQPISLFLSRYVSRLHGSVGNIHSPRIDLSDAAKSQSPGGERETRREAADGLGLLVERPGGLGIDIWLREQSYAVLSWVLACRNRPCLRVLVATSQGEQKMPQQVLPLYMTSTSIQYLCKESLLLARTLY
ncbi:hypothetical protein V8C26DRAFT_393162 [Trichoderma gracile]